MKEDHVSSDGQHGRCAARPCGISSAFLLTVLLLSACTTTRPPVPASQSSNPVIFVHGAMGSRLVDSASGRVIWGDFSRKDANGNSIAAIRGMALPMQRGRSLGELRDTTVAVDNLDTISLAFLCGLRLDVTVYDEAMERLQNGCCGEEHAEHHSCDRFLEFFYDWRRGCDENAIRLGRFIQSRKKVLVVKHGYPETMRFNVATHSGGGLLLRYYLRYGDAPLPRDGSLPKLTWEGARHVEKIAFVAPPNAGVGPVLVYLTDGHQAQPLLPKFDAAVVGTMPSMYQMLPRAGDGVLIDPEDRKSLDPLDVDLWIRKEWGLANPEQDRVLRILLPGVSDPSERRAIALDHLRKCLASARQFQAALDRPARHPDHLKMVVYAGNSDRTMVAFLATRRHPIIDRTERGDGTVALYSALRQPPRSEKQFFFHRDHMAIACKRDVNEHIISFFGSDE